MRIPRAIPAVRLIRHPLAVVLAVAVGLATLTLPIGHAADPQQPAAGQAKYQALVQSLASPNRPAIISGDSQSVQFPAGYDVAAQERVADARTRLHENLEESLPFLIEALDDQRYCMTIDWADGDAYYNRTVGQICRNIIAAQLEVYRDKIHFTGPQHWNRYNYSAISPEWWKARQGRKLFELQVEAVDWAIKRFDESTDFDRRFDREEQLANLQKLRDDIAKARTPAKSSGMLRMQTRDVE